MATSVRVRLRQRAKADANEPTGHHPLSRGDHVLETEKEKGERRTENIRFSLLFSPFLSLRIEYAMQVEGRRRRRGLTQHHMDLRSMVRLMVEQMAACNMRGFHVVFALVVRIGKRTDPERGIEIAEERFDPQVLARPRSM